MLKRPQHKRPIGIKLVAGAYLGFPVLGPLLMWLTYRNAPDSVLRTMQAITPGSMLVMASVVLVGLGILQVRPWGWYLFLGHSAFILAHNVFVFRSSGAFSLGLLVAANSALLLVAGMIIHANVRAPYFNPRLRYWEQKPRVAVRLQCMVSDHDGGIPGETFDVSESGAFVCCPHPDVRVGERRTFAVAWSGGKLACDAEVVWKSDGSRDVPTGIGIRFVDLNRTQRVRLRGLVKQFVARQPTQTGARASSALRPLVAVGACALTLALGLAYLSVRGARSAAQPVSIEAPVRARR